MARRGAPRRTKHVLEFGERSRGRPYTRRVYGYEPPKTVQPGGCRDGLVLMRVAFEVLTPIVGAGVAAMGIIALVFWLFSVHYMLGFIPVATCLGALIWLAIRDRHKTDEIIAEHERRTRGGGTGR